MYDIIGKRKWFFLFSGLMTIPGLVFILLTPITNGQLGLQFSIDYTGGTNWEIKFADPNVGADQIKASLVKLGVSDATVIATSGGFYEIRTRAGRPADRAATDTVAVGRTIRRRASASAGPSSSAAASAAASGLPSAAPSAGSAARQRGSVGRRRRPAASASAAPSAAAGASTAPGASPAPSAGRGHGERPDHRPVRRAGHGAPGRSGQDRDAARPLDGRSGHQPGADPAGRPADHPRLDRDPHLDDDPVPGLPVRGHGDRRARPRRARGHRHLRHPGDLLPGPDRRPVRDRDADDHRVQRPRHDRRLRPDPREPLAPRRRAVRPDRQPLDPADPRPGRSTRA